MVAQPTSQPTSQSASQPAQPPTNQRSLWPFAAWLPTTQQISNSLQLRLNLLIDRPAPVSTTDPTDSTSLRKRNEAYVIPTTMRQGVGLVLLIALLAGFLPFCMNWIYAVRIGAAYPLAQLTTMFDFQNQATQLGISHPLVVVSEMIQTMAGLPPIMPIWMAAGLSAFGEWINQTFVWLTTWLCYGLLVLLLSHAQGARTSLPTFYALTAYAAVPLIFAGFRIIPCAGPPLMLISVTWSYIIYYHAVRVTTGLPMRSVLISMLGAWLFYWLGTLLFSTEMLITLLGWIGG